MTNKSTKRPARFLTLDDGQYIIDLKKVSLVSGNVVKVVRLNSGHTFDIHSNIMDEFLQGLKAYQEWKENKSTKSRTIKFVIIKTYDYSGIEVSQLVVISKDFVIAKQEIDRAGRFIVKTKDGIHVVSTGSDASSFTVSFL
jgi:hypothetical protein